MLNAEFHEQAKFLLGRMRRYPNELHGVVRDRTITGHDHILEAQRRQKGMHNLSFQWSCNHRTMSTYFAPTNMSDLQLGPDVEKWLRLSVDEHMRLADLQHRAALAGAYHAQVDPGGETLHAEETCVDSDCPQHGTWDFTQEVYLPAGVYRYKDNFYLLIGLCRVHGTDDEFVAYVPLRTEPGWSGTARIALRPVHDFMGRFEFVGARQP